LAFIIILAIFILDQASKLYAVRMLSASESIPVIKNVFHLTLVYNTGAAFGIFRSQSHLFIVVAVLSVFFILFLVTRKAHAFNSFEKTALYFILGGTLGNLTDRLRLGHVIDFIDLRVWPVFNIADSFITVGAIMLALSIILRGRKRQ